MPAQPYVGQIMMFGGSFAPCGWAFCNGALLPISENEWLFNLIGTTYGGDGQETFALPNLSGRVPVHQGQGPGIQSNYVIGEMGGVESVTLTTQQIPVHNHYSMVTNSRGTSHSPVGNIQAADSHDIASPYAKSGLLDANMHSNAIQTNGGNQPHENMQPYLAVSFVISLFGVFPSQT